MPTLHYPDDHSNYPVHLTLFEFVDEAIKYYKTMSQERTLNDERKFLKFLLAGRRGLYREEQDTIALDMLRGPESIQEVTMTRDFDVLFGTTRSLPYTSALTAWPISPLTDTLAMQDHNNHPALDIHVSHLFYEFCPIQIYRF